MTYREVEKTLSPLAATIRREALCLLNAGVDPNHVACAINNAYFLPLAEWAESHGWSYDPDDEEWVKPPSEGSPRA